VVEQLPVERARSQNKVSETTTKGLRRMSRRGETAEERHLGVEHLALESENTVEENRLKRNAF
jgi:hypothetical protein